MFFIASKLFAWLIYPLGPIFAALLIVFLGYRQRGMRRLLAAVILLLYGMSAPVVVLSLVRWLEGPPITEETLRPHYDVAIVLTGMVDLRRSRPGHVAFNEHVERILEGMRLVKQGVADKLLIVGGNGHLLQRDGSEAGALRLFVVEFGLREEQVLTEEVSRNTYENAVKATEIIRAGDYKQLVLITSALHMARSAATFAKQGLTPDRYPVDFQSVPGRVDFLMWLPSTHALDLMAALVHELIGYVTYRVQGYI